MWNFVYILKNKFSFGLADTQAPWMEYSWQVPLVSWKMLKKIISVKYFFLLQIDSYSKQSHIHAEQCQIMIPQSILKKLI